MDKKRQRHAIIAEYLLGDTSTRKLADKYRYGHSTISRWVMAHQRNTKKQPLKYSKAVLESREPMPTDIQELQEALRLSRLKVELLEAMIDISDEQFGTDIRKKAGARQS
jgi:transposase-like protein